MSWQSYVDDQLIASGYVAAGALVGTDGSIWATSPDFITQDEASAIAAAFAAGPGKLQEGGVTVKGNKYFTLKAEANLFYGKKGPQGICAAKSGSVITIGVHAEGVNPAYLNQTVERLRDYLESSGY
eukprot:TRINITY_DN2178_c0_g1_i1.p1 TRINITY_DN2178_c0_g1~~TRINITY_DN2178_c0_g1_i1.p1  ORF type:complete len:127 (-),score=31.54 TRINITY_DN2178_c0_g1_i1:21-401(-)